MGRFTLPRDLYHGTGSLETLKTLTGKKAIVVVGGGSMKRFGFLDKAVAYLKEAGMEVELFEGVGSFCRNRNEGCRSNAEIPAGLDRCHGWWLSD